MRFDKVICIDDSTDNNLILDNVYTVMDTHTYNEFEWIILQEFTTTYSAERFKRYISCKISEILKEI
jgi:hypothetical protein